MRGSGRAFFIGTLSDVASERALGRDTIERILMFSKSFDDPNLTGALSALAAAFCFSLNDVSIKFLSGNYALHEIVLIRSVTGMIILLAVFLPYSGGLSALRTRRIGIHLLRSLCVVFANTMFFLGIAVLPLAEGVALFFVSPLLIAVFSVIFLKETVGPLRWGAISVGLIGVLVVLRPGTAVFQIASLFPVAAAIGYAALHMLTRYIGRTESALTMTFYIQATFIAISLAMGITVGDGRFGESENGSLEFLLRAWTVPATKDYAIFLLLGVASAFGGYFISQAYRVAEAAVVAPFEYVAMPLAVFWGLTVFGDWPDLFALFGILLILGSGLFLIWREARARGKEVPDTPRYRR